MVGCLPFGVSTGCKWSGNSCYFADVSKIGPDTAGRSAFCPPFLLFPWCIACKYGSISRFKGVFSAVWGFRVGLCCLGGLRGLWGFCVREWLGGLEACCVFASIYSFICLYLPFFLSLYLHLVLLSFVGLVAFRFSLFVLWFSLWVFVFSFSLTDYTQKERALRFCSLRPLFACCVCSDSRTIIEKLLRCVFGFFQFVRLILPTNTCRV